MLTKSKLNNTETLISQALIHLEITNEEFITIVTEKEKYGKVRENIRKINETSEGKTENTRLNSVNSRTEKNFFFAYV